MILEGERPARLLLDTCAVIYLFNGETMKIDAVEAIDMASILFSPISAWEIGVSGIGAGLPHQSFFQTHPPGFDKC